MSRLSVFYLGFLQQLAGVHSEEVEMPPGATVRDLIAALRAQRGEDLGAALVTQSGHLRAGARVIINDQHVSAFQGLDTTLPDQCEVTVLIGMDPIFGGQGTGSPAHPGGRPATATTRDRTGSRKGQ